MMSRINISHLGNAQRVSSGVVRPMNLIAQLIFFACHGFKINI